MNPVWMGQGSVLPWSLLLLECYGSSSGRPVIVCLPPQSKAWGLSPFYRLCKIVKDPAGVWSQRIAYSTRTGQEKKRPWPRFKWISFGPGTTSKWSSAKQKALWVTYGEVLSLFIPPEIMVAELEVTLESIFGRNNFFTNSQLFLVLNHYPTWVPAPHETFLLGPCMQYPLVLWVHICKYH